MTEGGALYERAIPTPSNPARTRPARPGPLRPDHRLGVLAVVGHHPFPHRRADRSPVQFAYSWFFAFYFFFTIALGSFFWVTLHYACDSDWSVLARRVWENILGLFPLFFVLFLPLLCPILRDMLWKWMQPGPCARSRARHPQPATSTCRSSTSASSSTSAISSWPGSITAATRSGRTPTAIRVLHPPDARSQLPRAGHLRRAGNLPRLRLVHGPRLALVLEPLRRLQLRRLRAGQHGGRHRPRRAAARGRLPDA